MKTILYAILTLLFFCIFFTSNAQLYKVELEEKIQRSSLIAEGKVVGQKCFWNDAHTMIYTSNTVEVYKVFKGNFSVSQIEIVTIGGSVDNDYVDASDLLKLDVGQLGVFFCAANPLNLRSPFTKQVLYDVYSSDQGFLRYDIESNIASAPFASYDDIKKNLYTLLVQKTGQPVRIINASFDINSLLPKAPGHTGLLTVVTSFSPATVDGGALGDPANNTLTINGSGFGASPSGSCAVRFKSGDDLNTTPTVVIPYTSQYMVSWSDTKIVVKVPGKAATGKLAVVTSSGTLYYAPSSLNVLYSVLNATFTISGSIFIREPRLMNTNGSGGYSVLYSTSTAGKGVNINTASEKATFQRALTTWKEQVGVNFTEGGTTTSQAVSGTDHMNIVMFDNDNTGVPHLSSGVLATTYSWFSVCYDGTQVFTAQKTGFDVIIRNNAVSSGNTQFTVGPCFPVPGSLDLEMIILHELGHALNLAHVNDSYEGSDYSKVNPGKLMHFQVLDYVNRRSLDYSAYSGGLYTAKKQSNIYSTCGLFASEMTQTAYTIIPVDECPASFPTNPTALGTTVSFDLVHATSNKYKDPQYSITSCSLSDYFVTNNAFYAIKTNHNGTLSIGISNYATLPASLASCSQQGAKMFLFDVNTCPAGQNFPSPIACRDFSGNTLLPDITGLLANHNYLLYFDGMRNTKVSFQATFNGTALPIVLSKFYGEYLNGKNNLYIDIVQAINVNKIMIEKGQDGKNFTDLAPLQVLPQDLVGHHLFTDAQPYPGNNYYRLRIIDNDGAVQYSNIILLKNTAKQFVYVYPNPVKNNLLINLSGMPAGKYYFSVSDISGKIFLNREYSVVDGGQTVSIPFMQTAPGVYVVKITDAGGNIIAREKVVK